MPITLAQLNKQISKLQREAVLLKASQAKDVIARIREEIAEYQLTAADLGLEKTPTPARRVPAKAAAAKAGKAGKAAKRGNVKKPAAIKFRDADGNAWSGRGRPPLWFQAALESGRTREDLEVKVD